MPSRPSSGEMFGIRRWLVVRSCGTIGYGRVAGDCVFLVTPDDSLMVLGSLIASLHVGVCSGLFLFVVGYTGW
ncbi:hypothetical protein GOP47_0020064 [Adiantum capillus-veneris]|uniref:Transmembrane protein n=1 Tax=Adiantum capillus-veneris TaxID=13818 RepID=A0A9D4UDN0_ADICA|nr:hypothetical protein GOP47_0020064 [Adiantum capillus-veneris]